jgi:hypothetical protein
MKTVVVLVALGITLAACTAVEGGSVGDQPALSREESRYLELRRDVERYWDAVMDDDPTAVLRYIPDECQNRAELTSRIALFLDMVGDFDPELVVTSIDFLGDDEALIEWALAVDGRRLHSYPGAGYTSLGADRMVLQDGRWQDAGSDCGAFAVDLVRLELGSREVAIADLRDEPGPSASTHDAEGVLSHAERAEKLLRYGRPPKELCEALGDGWAPPVSAVSSFWNPTMYDLDTSGTVFREARDTAIAACEASSGGE